MTDLTQTLSDLIDSLTPIHEAEAAFAKGGRECSRAIVRIYERLCEAEEAAADLEGEVEFLEEELRDEGELAESAVPQAEGSP